MPSKKKSKRKSTASKQQRENNNVGPAGNKSTTAPAKDALIIAIDFGTTFSGVAWHNTASKKEHLLIDWPNQTQSSVKVPTVLRYNSNGNCQWGHVRSTTKRLEWFKLLLNEDDYTTRTDLLERIKAKGLKGYPESISTHLANLQETIEAMPDEKKPADLAADFLRSLYKYVQDELGDNFPTLKEELAMGGEGGLEIKCCLTVPAIWDDKAKEITKQAAINAGLPEGHIYMISEPEAAAVHCLTDLAEMAGNLKLGDVYVIVDGGGGTVDLISYEVTSIMPQLRVSECTIGTGGLCGSTLLNRRFEALVISRIGQEAFDQMDVDDRYVMRNHFEKEIKPRFLPDQGSVDDDDDDGDDDGIICPLPRVPDDCEKRVQKSKILFSTNELKELFEPIFTDIAGLVQKQVDAVQETTKKNVNWIILVGGFGSSKYLVNWLTANVRNKNGQKIELIKPREPAAAIVRGALRHGVRMHQTGTTSEWGIVESRRARYHYGISICVPFRFGVHPQSKLAMDPFFGIPMCTGCMEWLIQRGAPMRQGVGISSEFQRRCPIVDSQEAQRDLLVFEEEIYVSAENTAPTYQSDPSVYRLLTYKTNFSDVERKYFLKRRGAVGLEYWMIPATILLKLESADLTFTTLLKGSVYGEGKKLYHHAEPASELPQAPERRARWRYCHFNGTVYMVASDEDNEHEHEHEHEIDIESELALLALDG